MGRQQRLLSSGTGDFNENPEHHGRRQVRQQTPDQRVVRHIYHNHHAAWRYWLNCFRTRVHPSAYRRPAHIGTRRDIRGSLCQQHDALSRRIAVTVPQMPRQPARCKRCCVFIYRQPPCHQGLFVPISATSNAVILHRSRRYLTPRHSALVHQLTGIAGNNQSSVILPNCRVGRRRAHDACLFAVLHTCWHTRPILNSPARSLCGAGVQFGIIRSNTVAPAAPYE